MGLTKTSIKLICTLPDPIVSGQKLTATCAVDNWGVTMFILKSKGSASDNKKYPISIIKVSKFTTTPTIKVITVKKNCKELGNCALHANSLCYARKEGESKGSLYVTTGNPKDKVQVIKMNSSGVVEQELYRYDIYGNKAKVSNLTFYGNINGKMYFITCIGYSSEGRLKYKLMEFDGSKFQDIRTIFSGAVTKDTGYSRNDITYKEGKLYHTFFKKNSKGIIYKNKIYVYDISSLTTLTGQVVEPIEILYSEAPKEYNKKYELEGVITYQGNIYAAGNMESSNASKNKDSVFKITRK